MSDERIQGEKKDGKIERWQMKKGRDEGGEQRSLMRRLTCRLGSVLGGFVQQYQCMQPSVCLMTAASSDRHTDVAVWRSEKVHIF